jgi:hypothetical protein
MTAPTVEPAGVSERELLDMTMVRLIAAIGTQRVSVDLAKDAVQRLSVLDRDNAALRQQLAEMRRGLQDIAEIDHGHYRNGSPYEKGYGAALHFASMIAKRVLNDAALAPTSQPSRGKCERCGGAKRIEQMPAPKGMKDESSPVNSYWIDCPNCAQPERQGADERCPRCLTGISVHDGRCVNCGELPESVKPSPPPTDDIVAGLIALRDSGLIDIRTDGQCIPRAIAALGEKGWQPIETAPKSGEFLAWVMRAGLMSVLVVHYCDYVEDHPPIAPALYFWTGYQFAPLKERPTHWMPMPSPPIGRGA